MSRPHVQYEPPCCFARGKCFDCCFVDGCGKECFFRCCFCCDDDDFDEDTHLKLFPFALLVAILCFPCWFLYLFFGGCYECWKLICCRGKKAEDSEKKGRGAKNQKREKRNWNEGNEHRVGRLNSPHIQANHHNNAPVSTQPLPNYCDQPTQTIEYLHPQEELSDLTKFVPHQKTDVPLFTALDIGDQPDGVGHTRTTPQVEAGHNTVRFLDLDSSESV